MLRREQRRDISCLEVENESPLKRLSPTRAPQLPIYGRQVPKYRGFAVEVTNQS